MQFITSSSCCSPPPLPAVDVLFGQLRRRMHVPRMRVSMNKVGAGSATGASAASTSGAAAFGGVGSNDDSLALNKSFIAGDPSSASAAASAVFVPSGAGDTLASSGTWLPTPGNERLRVALRQEENGNAVTGGGSNSSGGSSPTALDAASEDAPLRSELWHGVVEQPLLRAEAWRVALGVSQATQSRRNRDTVRHMAEYRDYVSLYYYERRHGHSPLAATTTATATAAGNAPSASAPDCFFPPTRGTAVPPLDKRTKTERDILNQLDVDLPRHSAALYKQPELCERLRRCLYVWSLRNPAVGYVQGMDDIVVIFFYAFLDEAFAMMEEFNRRREDWLARKRKELQQQQQEQCASALGDAAAASSAASPAVAVVIATTAEEDVKRWLSLRSEMLARKEGVPPVRSGCGGGFCRPWTEDRAALDAALAALPAFALDIAECDTYNCGGRFLSWGMDRYTFNQPGVLQCVDAIAAALKLFEPELSAYLCGDDCMVEHRAYAYKYAHLLMVRDLGPWLSMRLFDAMISIGAAACFQRFFALFAVAWMGQMREKLMRGVAPEEVLTYLQEPRKLGLPPHEEGRLAARWMDELLASAYLLLLRQRQHEQAAASKKNAAVAF